MDVDLDPDLVDLVPGFLERARAALEPSKAATDFAAPRKLGHNLKGTAATFGLPRLGELGDALERAAVSGDAPSVVRLLGEVSAEIERSEQALDEWKRGR